MKHFKNSPLWIIGLFITFAILSTGYLAANVDGWLQAALSIFVMFYAVSVTIAFFIILWFKPENFYAPSEYGRVSPGDYVNALRGLPERTTEAVTNLEKNPFDDEALFALIDNLLDEPTKQHLILIEKSGGKIDVSDRDEMGFSHSYEIVTRDKGLSFGRFSPQKFLRTLNGTNFVTLSGGRNKIILTPWGEKFVHWLIKNEKDAETFKSDIGQWGNEQNAVDVLRERMEKTKP